ncbi:hypothetical protein NDU88_001589 [Pleurodeles waltl]|uniref:Uncharacterized protein n=1 Tax=Pleurodeles waltl TaxID=8319 RepID=A0AAV7UWH0_PLEWA|nr:hypothetical protein NDU88_001589 [Pleurodeles waltl]
MTRSEKVIQALRMLQEEGREDLLKESAFLVKGDGMKRPRRASSEGVAAAVIACSPPASGKKYKQKSLMGRKYAQAAVLDMEAEVGQGQVLPLVSNVRRGDSTLARRVGASLRQRVASRGRGAAVKGAVASFRHLGAEAGSFAHAPAVSEGVGRAQQQAPLFSRKRGKRGEGDLEESTRAGAFKMAARIGDRPEPIIIDSDPDGGDPLGKGDSINSLEIKNFEEGGEASMLIQWVPRLVSPMLQKVHHWGVENMTLVKTGLMDIRDQG